MSEEELKERIAELEFAVNTLNTLWDKEYKSHSKTMDKLIELQKHVLGIKE
jgi:hypothetical protein